MSIHANFWKERLDYPAYRVNDAARYARTTPQTVSNWQRRNQHGRQAISDRERGKALSYIQLIELGVVAAMRKAGVKLRAIQEARNYLATEFNSKHPFAEYRFKRVGQELLVAGEQLSESDKGKLVSASGKGQYVWKEIVNDLLSEFEYPDGDGLVTGWRVAGRDNPILIDPRIAFGEPQVSGVATWVILNRWESGENLDDIAEDYDLERDSVISALKFEGVDIDYRRPSQWVH